MLPKIIRIEPTTPMIALTWMIGSRCNYDCMYCPEKYHDITSTHPDLEKLKTAWQNLHNKTCHHGLPYKISFTGGEVTANRSFLPLIEYLRSEEFNIGQLLIITNGSASENYYRRLCQHIDAITFSTHSEFFNEREFFQKIQAIDAIMIRPEKSLHVNIMNEFWNQDRITLYQDWLTKHNISHSINTIDYSLQIRSYPVVQGVKNFEEL